jgi:hypothetical protein
MMHDGTSACLRCWNRIVVRPGQGARLMPGKCSLRDIRMHTSEDGASLVSDAASSARGLLPGLFASSPPTVSRLANNMVLDSDSSYSESITSAGSAIGIRLL